MIEIIEKFKKENKPLKVNIACGQRKTPLGLQEDNSWIGIDKAKLDCVDIVQDLEIYPWIIDDNLIDEIYCAHYIEHTDNLIKFMNELWRILKPQAKAVIIAPYYTSMRAWQDPYHKRPISEATFLYWNKTWREQNKLDQYTDIKCDFDFNYGYIPYPEWASRNQEARDFAIKHYNNVIMDIQVNLIKK